MNTRNAITRRVARAACRLVFAAMMTGAAQGDSATEVLLEKGFSQSWIDGLARPQPEAKPKMIPQAVSKKPGQISHQDGFMEPRMNTDGHGLEKISVGIRVDPWFKIPLVWGAWGRRSCHLR